MLASSWHGGDGDATMAAHGEPHGAATARHELGSMLPDYVRLAYERIERTDELLARMEAVLHTARRALD